MKIEEGKWYKRRDGKIVGPAKDNVGDSCYPWVVGDETYTDNGLFSTHGTSRYNGMDLVEEIPQRNKARE